MITYSRKFSSPRVVEGKVCVRVIKPSLHTPGYINSIPVEPLLTLSLISILKFPRFQETNRQSINDAFVLCSVSPKYMVTTLQIYSFSFLIQIKSGKTYKNECFFLIFCNFKLTKTQINHRFYVSYSYELIYQRKFQSFLQYPSSSQVTPL